MPVPSTSSRPPPPVTLQVLDSAIPVLKLVQSVSAASFSVFSLIHLSAPLSALLPCRPRYIASPENRANGILLIGRELYQGQWSEPVLVYGSLAFHVASGVLHRWLRLVQATERRKWKRELVKDELRHAAVDIETKHCNDEDTNALNQGEQELLVEELEQLDELPELPLVRDSILDEDELVPRTPRLTSHQITGYVLVPIVWHHLYLHRILPASPLPPISALSPSFFNYTFTSVSLNHSSLVLRSLSTMAYASLASIATYHAIVGIRILSDPTAPRSLQPKRPKSGPESRRRRLTRGREWQAVWIAVVTGVGIGTARIAGYLGGERIVGTPNWIHSRMDHVLRKGWGMTR
ncbi:uncharacterized protein JCM15063_001527 [Sporobolomyces koalae]|uniref:uncharacterized protein n=1 Tax=Sporobolomyces koalae TaxID=500713 RepID=UPI00316F20DF